MKRKLALVFIFLVGLSLIAESVKAEQIVYLNFDGFQVVENSQSISLSAYAAGITKSYVYVLSFPSEKYLSSMTFADVSQNCDYPTDPPAHITITIAVNGQQVASKTFYIAPSKLNINWSPVKGTDFTINVTVTVVGPSTTISNSFSSTKQYFYVSSEPYRIASLLTSFKYVPPGADDTPQGLILNQTEIHLNKSYTLSEGTVSFWLKWDGSKSVTISDNIGIDTNGYLYVKNNAGTVYTLEGVQPPIGTYVPVYISWRNGEGYIMINTTKITLNWVGNLTISKIGSISQSTGTIIDEFKIWGTYIPADQIVYESIKEQYTLIYNGHPITIKPEGGQSLGIINVAFLDNNYNAINSTTLSSAQNTVTVPANTSIVILTRGTVSRTYYLDNSVTEIAFPAEESQVIVSRITARPSLWNYLTVKTNDGAIATRIKLENNEGSFTAVYGNQYLFVFERDNETRTRVYTISSSDIVFYIADLNVQLNPPIDVNAYVKDGLIVITYFDENMQTTMLNVTITGYENYKKAWELKDYQEKQFGLYTLKTSANNTEYAEVTIIAKINDNLRIFKRTVYVNTHQQRYPFPETFVPPVLTMLIGAVMGVFIFPGKAPYLMLLGGAVSLGILSILGWIPPVPGLITTLTLLGVLALVVYRRG